MKAAPLIKVGAVVLVLYLLLHSSPASSAVESVEDVFNQYPHPQDSDVGVDAGGNVTIVGAQCVGDCAGKTMTCPGDPECA